MMTQEHDLKLEPLGRLREVPSCEIASSGVSVGMECLDREMFDFERCWEPLGRSGVKWARVQTGWNRCETVGGRYDFGWLDNIVDKLRKVGVEPWFNVGYGNRLYMPDAFGDQAVGFVPLYYGDETLLAWKRYLRALALHFRGRVRRWEIWNEPDGPSFWQPHLPDMKEYARLIRESAPEIKAVIPDAGIGGCSASFFSGGAFMAFAETGIGRDLDFFSFHNYVIQPEKDRRQKIEAMRRAFARFGGAHVRIFQGESGYASWFPEGHWMHPWRLESEANQAKWLLRRYVGDFAAGIELSSFFQMADMVGKEYQMGDIVRKSPARHGLLDGFTYRPKESWHAIAHIAALFDADTVPTPLFASLNTYPALPREMPVSHLAHVAVVTETFLRRGFPFYLYYLPEDPQFGFCGCKNVELEVEPAEPGEKITNPVLIDLYRGTAARILETETRSGGVSRFKGLPLTDYPLAVTDFAAVADRIVPPGAEPGTEKGGE